MLIAETKSGGYLITCTPSDFELLTHIVSEGLVGYSMTGFLGLSPAAKAALTRRERDGHFWRVDLHY